MANNVCNYRLHIWTSFWSVRVSETVFLQTEIQFFLRCAHIQMTSAAPLHMEAFPLREHRRRWRRRAPPLQGIDIYRTGTFTGPLQRVRWRLEPPKLNLEHDVTQDPTGTASPDTNTQTTNAAAACLISNYHNTCCLFNTYWHWWVCCDRSEQNK